MFSQTCRRVISSVHGGGVCASGSGGCTPPGRAPPRLTLPPPGTHTPLGLAPPGHNGQQAGGTHPTGMLSFLFFVGQHSEPYTYLSNISRLRRDEKPIRVKVKVFCYTRVNDIENDIAVHTAGRQM